MKFRNILTFAILFPSIAWSQGNSSKSQLQGPYLGQKAPGNTPQVFAPGIVSTDAHEFSCSFTPDGKEFYFTRRGPELNRNLIMVAKQIKDTWTEPEVAPFIENRVAFEPIATPDGKRLYFSVQEGMQMNMCYVEREGDNWKAIKNPGHPFNPMKSMYVSMTLGGTIYTTDISEGPGREGIAVIKRINGQYRELERLGPPINVGKQEMYPFIAPDESYLIFNSTRTVEKINSGLFISFKKQDGTWSDPQAIDVGMDAGCPIVSPDGKYFFFTAGERKKSDIYWVDAKFIEELRPKE
ncbi:MAG: PD40 domain-containing protein [Fidelibacterota bacterium]|nr:MAG: PD40 domain-containing protein [Candidatus Neomarinimicrobiota bacterium]